MSLTQERLAINSSAALMAAILEQAGHVTQFLEDCEFSDCCKFILYSFYENRDLEVVSAIEQSSMVHMQNLSNDGQPCITDNKWLFDIGKTRILEGISCANDAWSSWEPEHSVARLMKNSFGELF